MISFDNYFTNPAFTGEVSFNGGAFGAMPSYLKAPLLAGLPSRAGHSQIAARLNLPIGVRYLPPNLNAFLGCVPIPAGSEVNATHVEVMTRMESVYAATSRNQILYRKCLGTYANFSNYLRRPAVFTPKRAGLADGGSIIDESSSGLIEWFRIECSGLTRSTIAPVIGPSQIAVAQIWSGPAVPIYPLVKGAGFDTRSQYSADRAFSSNLRGATRNAWRTMALEYACPAEWYHGIGGLAELEARGQGTEIVCILSPMPYSQAGAVVASNTVFDLLAPDTTVHGVVSSISSSVIRASRTLGPYYSVRIGIEACV